MRFLISFKKGGNPLFWLHYLSIYHPILFIFFTAKLLKITWVFFQSDSLLFSLFWIHSNQAFKSTEMPNVEAINDLPKSNIQRLSSSSMAYKHMAYTPFLLDTFPTLGMQSICKSPVWHLTLWLLHPILFSSSSSSKFLPLFRNGPTRPLNISLWYQNSLPFSELLQSHGWTDDCWARIFTVDQLSKFSLKSPRPLAVRGVYWDWPSPIGNVYLFWAKLLRAGVRPFHTRWWWWYLVIVASYWNSGVLRWDQLRCLNLALGDELLWEECLDNRPCLKKK